MILDELRYIRKRMDTAIGPDNGQAAPPPPPTWPLPVTREQDWDAEIVEQNKSDQKETQTPPPPPTTKTKPKQPEKPTPQPEKPTPEPEPEPKETEADPQIQSHAAPTAQEPKNTDSFGLKAPTSPEQEAQLFSTQRGRIENMMAVAQFARAEKLAQALLAVMPDNAQAEAMLDTVRRESTAFRTEQQSRLFAEFQKWTESRQWIKAQTTGEQLIKQYPASEEGQTVAASMDTVRKNAHFEEARTLRDRIGDLIKRKRYSEAVEIAEDLIRRFPNTRVAKQLRALLPDLKRRDANFR